MFKSIYPDMKCFHIYEIIILFILFSLVISFSVIDFNVLIHENNNKNVSLIGFTTCINEGNSQWQCSIMTLSGVASFTGIMAVILTSKRKISTFFWGIINNFVLGLFAFSYGYAGNAQIYIFFATPLQFIGLFMWYNANQTNQTNQTDQTNQTNGQIDINIEVKKLSWLKRLIYLIIFLVIGVCFYFEIPAFSKALTGVYPYETKIVPHILDAVSNSAIIMGNVLMLVQCIEQWPVWFLLDCIVITMYSGIGNEPDFNILLMACVYLLNSLYGFALWFKIYMKQNQQIQMTSTTV
jgi:nicotinamide mononucleotide transporter